MSRSRSKSAGPPAHVRVVPKHHALVRWSHWLHVPLLLGLLASGLSIYWAAPVFRLAAARGGEHDVFGAIGAPIAHALGDSTPAARNWIYDHLGLGTRRLAFALRLHWALAYPYLAIGVLYVIGLAAGGGWRALIPRPSDAAGALAMLRYYAGVVPMAILRRPWPHPAVRSKYNPLQRAAYFTMPILGALVVASGWAMHKPSQLGLLERAFGSYDGARVVHFFAMAGLGSFLVPHVALAVADGWDTLRSMIVGWSARLGEAERER